ncbi:DMT family transporter [Methanosarcina sp. Mfa9]|uniref:DMT family transporter n=1 Tax=Methanosarcina sp. Mfa9 TaxID=3439063 RepID=UPI003F842E6F
MPITVLKTNNPSSTLILSCVLFGMVGIFVKGINGMGPAPILFYRLFFGFAAILIYLIAAGRFEGLHLGNKKSYLFLLGVLNTVTMFSYFSAMKYSSIPVAVLLLYTAPVYVTLLSPFLLKEKITARSMIALTLSLAGILLTVNPGHMGIGTVASGEEGTYFLGLLFGLLSGFSFGCSILTVNHLKSDYSGTSQLLWSTLVGLVLLLPFGVSVPGEVLIENLGRLVPLGIITTAVGTLLYMNGIVHIRAQTAAVLCLMEPVSSIFFGCTLLGDPLQANTLFGCCFILCGGLLVSLKGSISLPGKKRLFRLSRRRRPGLFQTFMPPRPGKL